MVHFNRNISNNIQQIIINRQQSHLQKRLFPAFSWVVEEWLAGWRVVSVCHRYNSHQLAGNDRIATKLARDGPQISLHPGCAQGQGQVQRSRDTGTFVLSRKSQAPRGLLYVLTVYPAESWAPRVRAHEFTARSVVLPICHDKLSVRPSVCLLRWWIMITRVGILQISSAFISIKTITCCKVAQLHNKFSQGSAATDLR